MDAERKAELRKMCEETTPGPWKTDMHGSEVWTSVLSLLARPVLIAFMNDGEDDHQLNAAFIVAARTAVPDLLDALEEAERERDARETVIARLREQLEAARKPTAEHYAWQRLMDGTPQGTRPMPVYLTDDGHVVVCGPPDPREGKHNCEAMGCSSVSHVAWRGHIEDLWPLLWERERDHLRDVLRTVLDLECMVSAGPEFGAVAEPVSSQLPPALRAEAEAACKVRP